ncbi:molecular chaperone [Erythrobacter sp. SCSIO 43205]|uniref:ATP12 family chaperone protein n=1 Tax=Erythrobacter sp. SCSIO 43205 TaxID=2779361 RepID=UPI001CA89457|nr:ATP12 family protein [Erythrobacter sp. SCSIO 43205]UAB79083.1 molecular chaperone [Erythrobacter sp. SCSIO 43205]
MKRFYKQVSVNEADGGWQVMLDTRALKTVKGSPQVVPSMALAEALAAEWDAQGEKVDPATMPMRDMADYAIDIVAPDPATLIDKAVQYGDTDTLLYRADPDEPLYARQHKVWEPIVTGFENRLSAKFTRISGIIHRPQSESTLAALRDELTGQSPFSLAAIEMMTHLAASLITGLSAAQKDADALALWNAASLEEEWQAEQWGRDEEAEERREKRTADFLKAHEFWTLANA